MDHESILRTLDRSDAIERGWIPPWHQDPTEEDAGVLQ